MSGELHHEQWCDPRHCDAEARRITPVPAHRSTPFTVDLADVVHGGRPVGVAIAWLEREVGPGITTTYLRIQPRDSVDDPGKVLSFPIKTLYTLTHVLDGILGRPGSQPQVDDYVREDLETGRPIPPYVTGYRAGGPVARAAVVGRNAPGRFSARPSGLVANRA